jgi:hypothetical protein
MTSTDVHHIPLPSLPANELHTLVQLIQAVTSHSKIQRSSVDIDTSAFPLAIKQTLQNWVNIAEERGIRIFQDTMSSDDIFKSILKMLWVDVVKPVITFLDLKVGLQFKAYYFIYSYYMLEIRKTTYIAMVSYWAIFFPPYSCSWLL